MRLSCKKQIPDSSPKQEKLAAGIAGNIIRWQTRIAVYLNSKTKDLSGKSLLILLILFCALFAAINLYLLIQSI